MGNLRQGMYLIAKISCRVGDRNIIITDGNKYWKKDHRYKVLSSQIVGTDMVKMRRERGSDIMMYPTEIKTIFHQLGYLNKQIKIL
jgi:hypothetical protein